MKGMAKGMTKPKKVYLRSQLSEGDREKIALMDRLTDTVLSDGVVNDYLNECVEGETVQKLYKEVLTPFLAYVRERAEFNKTDFIISAVDGYEGK